MSLSPNHSGTLKDPRYVVLHYTASGSFNASKAWLCLPKSEVSAHILIGREGEKVQLVDFDKCAWHAGKSAYKSLNGLNRYSIGIELVSYGPLIYRQKKFFNTVDGNEVPAAEVVQSKPPDSSYEFWQDYTKPQLFQLEETLVELFHQFPSLKEVVGHRDIAPGRKQDPWPLDVAALNKRYGTCEHVWGSLQASYGHSRRCVECNYVELLPKNKP